MSGDKCGLIHSLHPCLNRALASYENFLAKEDWTDAKEFSTYHTACKSALSHIALLMKLTTVHDKPDHENTLFDWIAKAKTAMQDIQTDVEFD